MGKRRTTNPIQLFLADCLHDSASSRKSPPQMGQAGFLVYRTVDLFVEFNLACCRKSGIGAAL